jgi:hypothetical protein
MIEVRKLLPNMLIVAISRNGKIIIPHGQTRIESHDTLYVIGERLEIQELHNRVYERGKYTNLQKVMIIGGGKTGYYLAEKLSEFGIAVKIVEKSKERCYYLSTHLEDVMILHGDATDTSLLEEELHLLTLQYEEAQEKQNNLAFVVNLRENSELALHKKWIIELQSLTSNLEKQVSSNEKTIKEQTKEITTLKDSLSNLEKAFNLELKALEEKLFLALEKNDTQSKQEIEDLKGKIATLSENVKSIANNPYFAGSSSNGYFNNRFGGSNSNIPVDDRDLRTDVNSNLLF